ncbi:MmgE/PrpD family protein [Rhizobium cauense]|uniref:MmgE/PrpD family protein n=1 Tax=Rhizobium cauense TaxID=1166683 RepID=UPI001C6E3967|nr:MmgE/PrpD family protein [Rhizobium cauense]MBW9117980.1 MmgE/PrpD family protein [Rhizobium cauense]
MHLTKKLAEHIATIARIGPPPETRDIVLRSILDLIGAAAAGRSANSSIAALAMAPALFGVGNAPIWLSGKSSTLLGAVVANATAASALDIDDGHRAARGHPGAAVVPTALTLAATHHCGSQAVIAAIVAGYDIGVRVAASQNPLGISTRQSGRWASLATVATAAVLLKVDPPTISQALSIAGVLAPNQQANGSSGYSKLTGNDVKEGIAWSSATGLMALELAIHGHTGPEDLLDHPDFYKAERILADLGSRWEILGTYFKPYACCRYIHPSLDRLFELIERHSLRASDVIAIEVETFEWALKLGNKTNPTNLIEVQYSLPYCLAIAFVDGRDSLLPPTHQCLDRQDLSELANKVRLSTRTDIDGIFPTETLARVTVETKRSRFASDLGGPLGDPRQPLLWHGIEEKFRRLTRDHLPPRKQQGIIDGVVSMASGDTGPMLLELESQEYSRS